MEKVKYQLCAIFMFLNESQNKLSQITCDNNSFSLLGCVVYTRQLHLIKHLQAQVVCLSVYASYNGKRPIIKLDIVVVVVFVVVAIFAALAVAVAFVRVSIIIKKWLVI